MKNRNVIAYSFAFILLLVCVNTSFAKKGELDITYTVKLSDPATRLFNVTTDIKNIDQPRLDLALPTWTPGWYTVENYGKNLLRFKITDATGKRLPFTMSRKQTWNVDTRGLKEIRIEYDYSATILALNQAKIADDFAFFTGIELFLEPLGHRQDPSTVKFEIPQNWKLISALKETADPMTYKAVDYDTLVDAPTQMGSFDVTEFQVEGKPHYFVSTPAGDFSKEKSAKFVDMLSKTFSAQSKIFGGLPYEKYIAFYFFTPPESNASGALEHLNSYVAFAPPGNVATPENIIGTASHEFFHLWNVKRFRPAEMWPYDYSRENETSHLWVSEGFTNYYGIVAIYRAGLMTEDVFLRRAAGAIEGIENNDARNYISPASASVSTWVGYDSPVAFNISYYTQGQNLAALLDLSIRNDSKGKHSLDDVMVSLYRDYGLKNKGFTTPDLLSIIKKLTGKDYQPFFKSFVFGTEIPDYDKIYGYAGYKVEKTQEAEAVLGFSARFRNGGLTINNIETGQAAESAGLEKGDVIKTVDGKDIRSSNIWNMAGKTLKLGVERNSEDIERTITFGSKPVIGYAITSLAKPTADQLNIRQGWLKR